MAPSSQNWILRGVFEVTFVDTTNRLAAIHFLVLAAKGLVLSTNVTSKTPLKIQFYNFSWKKIALRAYRTPAVREKFSSG